jgi:hypothetical protein
MTLGTNRSEAWRVMMSQTRPCRDQRKDRLSDRRAGPTVCRCLDWSHWRLFNINIEYTYDSFSMSVTRWQHDESCQLQGASSTPHGDTLPCANQLRCFKDPPRHRTCAEAGVMISRYAPNATPRSAHVTCCFLLMSDSNPLAIPGSREGLGEICPWAFE